MVFFSDSGNWTVSGLMISFVSGSNTHGATAQSRQAAPRRENLSRYVLQYGGSPPQKRGPTPCHHLRLRAMAAKGNVFPANAPGWQDSARNGGHLPQCGPAADSQRESALLNIRYRAPPKGKAEIAAWGIGRAH